MQRCQMFLPYPDSQIKELLHSSNTIAVVGLSPKENRPSNMVGRYLKEKGYRIIPVNPGQKEILGEVCYPDLDSVGEKIDIVNIFRRPEDTPPIVEQAVAAGVKAVWMQQGVVNQDAAGLAREAGLMCIMDFCIKIEHARLFSDSQQVLL